MSFSIIPLEIKQEIMSFVNPSEKTCQELKFCGRSCSLINKELTAISSEKMQSFKNTHDALRIQELMSKYTENSSGEEETTFQLYDALSSGCPRQFHSSNYSLETEHDVKDIVRLLPQTFEYKSGKARCRDNVTPLWIACHNDKIGLPTIEFLLKSGANPNSTIYVIQRTTKVIQDVKNNLSNERYEAILALFQKYGLESID